VPYCIIPQLHGSSKEVYVAASSCDFLFSGIYLNKYLQILSLPDEFSEASNSEILAYLKELHSSTSIEICRMRVMVVGPGDAGKTTLVHRLLTDEFSPNQFLMTDGVSMKEWKPTPQMNFSLWDFGGQQMYLNTHAMLFADKTLYLLVWNPRAGTDPRVLEEYLLNIRSRSQSCLVMLVSIPYLSKYAYLSHHNVDSCTGMGIDQLKQSIVSFVSQDFAEHS
jgi:internalin A